ncbi:hypothetical protein FRZ03_31875 [Streptomyces misionensis]|uniref:Uncharacterized protein n=1 Tax=Streptomyces misionensis TaxID=67331 RepID=A0A5C6IWR5_9ACTN|nr:hypothetical protein FRZ03_31875 [Streptomyces misionensis]
MPSLTVLVSSDTDIYISPGLYGDCLPTSATGASADSFRAGRHVVAILLFASSCSHMPARADSGPTRDPGHLRDVPSGIHVTWTRWPSSN